MSALVQLREVRELLAEPSRLTVEMLARDRFGFACEPESDKAVCWCLIGACQRVEGGELFGALYSLIKKKLDGGPVGEWSDRNGHAAVMKLLDELIAEQESR